MSIYNNKLNEEELKYIREEFEGMVDTNSNHEKLTGIFDDNLDDLKKAIFILNSSKKLNENEYEFVIKLADSLKYFYVSYGLMPIRCLKDKIDLDIFRKLYPDWEEE